MTARQVSRRRFLQGVGAAGLCALCGTGLSGCQSASSSRRSAVSPAAEYGVREALFYTSFRESGLDCQACHDLDPPRVLYCHSAHGTDHVRCRLCPRECIISRGQRGECGVRENREGRLHTAVYGRVCAANIDPIEKKPFYHFLPRTASFSIATAGCNLHCLYCQNWAISQSSPEELDDLHMTPEQVVRNAMQSGSRSIAYTYSEPTVFYEFMLDTARLARVNGLRNVVVSAGYINPEPLDLLCQAVDAIKIDLKGFNEAFYQDVCDGSLQPVLDSLKVIHRSGVHLEIVNLVVPTLNDDLVELGALSRWVVDELGPDVPLHFSRFHPEYRLTNLPSTPVETLERARQAALEAGLQYVYLGNVPGHEGDHTYCPRCGELIVGRLGFTVVDYHIVDGGCEFCGEPIAGVWA